MMAAGNGQLRIARRLLDAGANPRSVGESGATALSIAVSGGALTDIENPLLGSCHTEIVRELLRRDPGLRLGDTLHARFARWTAWLNGCDDVISIVADRAQHAGLPLVGVGGPDPAPQDLRDAPRLRDAGAGRER
jgi:hypothetical protein